MEQLIELLVNWGWGWRSHSLAFSHMINPSLGSFAYFVIFSMDNSNNYAKAMASLNVTRYVRPKLGEKS